MSASQQRASRMHRRRASARGLVRVEVQATRQDAILIRSASEALRGEPDKAQVVRSALQRVLGEMIVETAFDVFGTELPDEIFADVFEQPRQPGWRPVDL